MPLEYASYIVTNVKAPYKGKGNNSLIWISDIRVQFTVKSTWEYIRYREQTNSIYSKIWVKGLPFKMAFFMWRAWKFKVPVDYRMRRGGYEGPLRYWCCQNPKQETMSHVFLKAFTANRTWSYFASCARINIQNLPLIEVIMRWWDVDVQGLVPCYNVIPTIIMWEL